MAKKQTKLQTRALLDEMQANSDRIIEIADVCEREGRTRNESEEEEYNRLAMRNQVIEMRLRSMTENYAAENPNARAEAETIIRENVKAGKKTEVVLVRDMMMVSDMANSATVPLNVRDILEPLEEGLILGKVGLPFLTGLVGDYVWPVYEMVEAVVLGEGASLSDTKIPFSKLTATPARCGIKVPVSNQSLIQTDGVLETVVRKVMPKAIQRLLNRILFGCEAVNTVAAGAGLVGPFVAAKEKKVKLSAIPTFTELNAKMKAKVLETGIEGDHLCWTMSKSMQAILEGQPINPNGVYVPMVQNGMLCGLPIYTSNEMHTVVKSYQKYTAGGTNAWAPYTLQENDTVTYQVSGDTVAHALAEIDAPQGGKIAEVSVITEYIGLGDWSYQPMGLFGNSLRFIVDPYTGAGEDCVKFVLNCDYGTKTLRPEAFMLGEVAASAD